jgi:hypothetical protein
MRLPHGVLDASKRVAYPCCLPPTQPTLFATSRNEADDFGHVQLGAKNPTRAMGLGAVDGVAS